MPQTYINFTGHLFQDDGDPVSGATVQLLEANTTTVEDSTTTNSDGKWTFAEADQDRYDIKITSGTSVRYIRWDDEISVQELDVRNNASATTPAATFSNVTNSASNQIAIFRSANSTRADNDEIYLSFELANSAGDIEEFARMTAVATDVTDGHEDAQIEFDVRKSGTLTKVWTITSSDAGAMSFDMNVDALTIGSGADTDISLTFDANSADGVITWMEDEDYFKFSDDILMSTTEKIQLRDTAIYIYSSTDGQLDLVADTEIQIAATTVDINGAVAFDGALTGITNITLSGTLSDGNYTFDTSGNVSGLGTVGSGAITSTGLVTGAGFTSTSDFTSTAQATDWDLIDNTASALSFDASGKAGILEIDTRNGAERVTMSGGLVVTGDLTVTGDDLTMGTNTSTAILVADGTNYNPVVPSGVIDLGNDGAFTLDNTVISSQTEITSGLAAADELLYSDGGTVKKIGLDNFVELAPTLATEDAIANGDYILFLDGGASGNMNKEAVHDLATLFAGSGLTATNSVIAVDTLNQDTSGTAAIATTVTITDNESTDEDNAIVFTAGGDVDGGNLGLESDGTLTYNPSTGKITATGFLGAIDGILGANSAAAITGTTIDATTDFTIGDTVITDGVITDSTGLQLAANLDIDGTADISGDLTLSGGADGALQFANAGENSIKIPDNQASALIIEEANNAYITFVTTNSSEAITVAKATTFSAGIADSGTIAAGTWNGTDVGVAYGGTGASSLTDGGVLLGSGTSAVTAMAVLADSEMIVGDGTTDPVAESGATLRTSIGVGTGDSPQFTDLTLTDDLTLNSDSSVFNMGAGNDFTITHDGTTGATLAGTPITVNSTGALTLDSSTDIVLDADGDNITFKAGSGDSTGLDFSNSSGTWTIKAGTSDADIVFVANDGGTANEVMRIDASASVVTLGGNAAGPGELRILEDTDLGSHYTGFKAGNATASVSYVLPLADGSADQVLSTDGSGTLAWASAGSGATQIQAYVYAMSVGN